MWTCTQFHVELELGPGEAVADWPLPGAEADETAVARPRVTGSVTGRASRTQASGGSLLGDDRGSGTEHLLSEPRFTYCFLPECTILYNLVQVA